MFELKSTISKSSRVDEDDVKNTKTVLRDFGLYPKDKSIEGFTDNEMFDGIKDFQKIAGLKVDGIMRPQGETEESINHVLFSFQDVPKPTRKPETNRDFQPPIPQKKPDIPESDEEILERLKHNIKNQKKLYDFFIKGNKSMPSLLFELQKRTLEITDDQVI